MVLPQICGYIGLYLIEKPEHTFKYTMNIKWNDFALIHKGTYTSSCYSDSDNTIEIPGRYIGDICVERSWKDWLVYLDVTNFLDKDYEKYRGRSGAERIFRLGLQRTTSCPLTFILSASTCHRP